MGPDTLKLGPSKPKDASLIDLQKVFKKDASLTDIWKTINQTNMFLWYAGLIATAHFDSGCLIHFNHMYDIKPFFEKKYMIVPWGTDQTMKCTPKEYLLPTSARATCNPMKTCFKNKQCTEEYEKITKNIPNILIGQFSCLIKTIIFNRLIY